MAMASSWMSPREAQLAKVDDLVNKYSRISYPSPLMHGILNDPVSYSLLVSALRRQVSLVKCRSQEFEDCQVTIYDRALLVLSGYGDKPMDLGALELYLTEFLGIVPIASLSDSKEIISNHLQLHKVLNEASRPVTVKGEDADNDKEPKPVLGHTPSPSSDDREGHGHHPTAPRDISAEMGNTRAELYEGRLEDRVERILDVYRRAKDDYFGTKARDGVDSLSAVRFLRDTAENALRYLHTNGLLNHSSRRDLETMFVMARDKTAQLLGGRNRHFDENAKRRRRRRGHRNIDSYRPRRDKC